MVRKVSSRDSDSGARVWPTDAAIVAALVVATLTTRFPLRSRFLFSWDSVLFALGMENFDVNAAQPHAPGFPVFIVVARAFQVLFGEANASLVALAMACSAAGIVLLYGFVRWQGSRRAALVASALFLVSPLFFFQGLVALSYVIEVPLSIGIAMLAWRNRWAPTQRTGLALGALWGIALGVRPSLLFSMSPLVAWSFLPNLRHAKGLRRVAASAVAALGAALAWVIPTGLDTGFQTWRRDSAIMSDGVVFARAVGRGTAADLVHRAELVASYFRYEALVVGLVLAVILAVAFRGRPTERTPFAHDVRRWGPFLAWWTLPQVAFMVLVYAGHWPEHEGYALVSLPPIYVAASLVVDHCWAQRPTGPAWRGHAWKAFMLTAILAVGGTLGVAAPRHARSMVDPQDEWLSALQRINAEFDPDSTILVPGESWSWTKWYFPEFRVWTYFEAFDSTGARQYGFLEARNHREELPYYEAVVRWPDLPKHPVPSDVHRFVLIDGDALKQHVPGDVALTPLPITAQRMAYVMEPSSNRTLIEEYFTA